MSINNIKLFKGIFLNENRKLLTYSAIYDFVLTFNGTTYLENNGSQINLYLHNEFGEITIDNSSYYLFFNKELIKDELELQFLNQRTKGLLIHLSYVDSAHFMHLTKLLISSFFKEGQELSLLFVRNIIEQIILMMMLKFESKRESKRKTSSINPIDRHKEIAHNFLELVKKHFRTDKKVAQYSTKMRITEKILNRSTKLTFNYSPKELIHFEIIQAANELLLYSDLSIKEISYQLGFEEDNNFSAFFKKHTGRTPRAYRDDAIQGTV
ncbi:helix-turn-helix transcriptional regulator [Sphingobacterium olei]|uniref:Helix-turn-helix transcriptional regulator n=1 Tax=Sphingobacterium olei TaxID=2571155 RepID=A0A4U0NZR1_9SPHI|nr:AraC family transcriptional regulator [Sphingobacterium olei]TJZ60396.1 helix-turn-helix transcriptional regulator [Sphingobacterium olei]